MMQSATRGIFKVLSNEPLVIGPESPFVVSGIPKGLFRVSRARVLLAGKVLGNIEIKVPMFGLMQVPHLKFVDVLVGGQQMPEFK